MVLFVSSEFVGASAAKPAVMELPMHSIMRELGALGTTMVPPSTTKPWTENIPNEPSLRR